MSIAVFDSGVGGISVLKSLVEVMPNEDFIYYGDSANAPYGTTMMFFVCSFSGSWSGFWMMVYTAPFSFLIF